MSRVFEMKLRPVPFSRICCGEKTIEYRLHDEKRSLLNKGDYIRFTEIADETRTVLVEIIDIITAPSFVALEQKLIEIGFLAEGAFSPTGMREYYSVEDEEKYGVMGIRIRVATSATLEP
jgi:ASC-1-like (ASCH) protein